MKKIIELLPEESVDTLIRICRTYQLRRYSGQRKDGLINLIIHNIINPNTKKIIQSLIPHNGTTALIMKTFIDNNNEIGYSKLREEVLKNRSGSAFRGYYRVLKANFIIFESKSPDEDIFYLPKEFTEFGKKVIDEKLEEPAAKEEIEELTKEEEEKEKKEINTIDRLLYSKKYTEVESLKILLHSLDLKTSGNKSELIGRLLYESNMPSESVIDHIFGKQELKDICRDFELYVSGNKNKLIDRILELFPIENPEKVLTKIKPPTEIKVEEKKKIEGMASSEGKIEKKIQQPKLKKEKLKDQIFRLMERQSLNPLWVKEKKIFEGYFISSIPNVIKTNDATKDVKVKPSDNKNEPIIVVEREDEKVGICPFFFDRTKKGQIKKDMLYKISVFQPKYCEDLVCYVYDPEWVMDDDTLAALKNQVLLIRKKKADFIE